MSRRSRRIRRTVVAALGALCLASNAAPALAQPGGDQPWIRTAPQTDQQVSNGDRPVDHPGVKVAAGTDQQIMNGDRPSDRVSPTIEVVRTEPTVVRNAVPTVAYILAGLALLVALAGGAELLVHRRPLQPRTD